MCFEGIPSCRPVAGLGQSALNGFYPIHHCDVTFVISDLSLKKYQTARTPRFQVFQGQAVPEGSARLRTAPFRAAQRPNTVTHVHQG
jgi:hypothetical protein